MFAGRVVATRHSLRNLAHAHLSESYKRVISWSVDSEVCGRNAEPRYFKQTVYTNYNCTSDFRCFIVRFQAYLLKLLRKIAKIDYQLRRNCLSVRPHGTTLLPQDAFSLNLSIFRKSVEEIQVSLKSDKNNGYFILITGTLY